MISNHLADTSLGRAGNPRPARLRVLLALLFLFASAAISSLHAQIGYVQQQADGSLQLHRMNADGTNDLQIGLPFTTFAFPTFSRDGTQLAVTALDPALPIERSENVFSLNTTNGAVNELTFYGDLFDSVNGVIIYNFPFYKAFSPDNSKLAVFAYIQYANASDIGTQTTTPSLEVYTAGVASAPIQVHVDKGLNGTHHGGEGVDWSPTANLLAAPLEGTANFQSGGGPGEITAIHLIEPTAGAVLAGHSQQVTFPRADSQISGSAPFLWGEHDYQPKFSPNGVGLAYVRSFQNFFLLTKPTPEPYVESIRILNLVTGADTQVIQFAPGLYITSLDWSPDGNQLIFDLGVQSTVPLGPLHSAVPETNEVYIVNSADGSGLTKVRGPGASTPAWSRTALPPPLAPNLGNISTRLGVGSGDNVLIGGFIITGSGDKNVIVRALGPSLGAAGVTGAMPDPTLELHDSTGALIASNDNWKQTQKTDLEATGLQPTNDLESAIVRRLTPGSYTAIVRGKGAATGVGLVEAYDLDGLGKLANISTRGLVQTDDNVMIGGFIVLNTGVPTEVVVRAIGPSLGTAGVTGALADPTLELHDQNGGLVASNDNWMESQKKDLEATGLQPTNDLESAIVQDLNTGAYTAIVRGKNNSTGVGLIEVYNLQ
ncbi:MAG: hypothetical protein ABI016_08120 [Chthoniobacterales bacterium]